MKTILDTASVALASGEPREDVLGRLFPPVGWIVLSGHQCILFTTEPREAFALYWKLTGQNEPASIVNMAVLLNESGIL